MNSHDRYQSAVYAGLLGVWTCIISPTNAVEGPYCVCAADVWVAGAFAGDSYHAGAQAADVHHGGGVAGQGDCC